MIARFARFMQSSQPADRQRPVLVLDFGSQYVQLIARRVRERHAFARIVRHDVTVERIRELDPLALILSGGPSSVYEHGAPRCDPRLFELGLPILGICYGMQLVCEAMGGRVEPAPRASMAGPNAGSSRRTTPSFTTCRVPRRSGCPTATRFMTPDPTSCRWP